jgi:hypothetical protein
MILSIEPSPNISGFLLIDMISSSINVELAFISCAYGIFSGVWKDLALFVVF